MALVLFVIFSLVIILSLFKENQIYLRPDYITRLIILIFRFNQSTGILTPGKPSASHNRLILKKPSSTMPMT